MGIQGIFPRHIVTAFNADGQAYRYMAETEADAERQASIFADMGLHGATVRRVLWDTRKGVIV